ncbi:prepilin-type N-terminal cleavage/methylation domain-containing protein [Candidatus Ruminimicrobiellum ovillum]|uniref:prepilin-type N-terminal cleavage/methylation domain-containing protein n=1 Tax=Candidatus Ruminimicrobiellum ovillum TaxID=1947927 RepID=UPI00355A7BF0
MKKTKRGFTLVELVIVIVIVGILSVISVPIYRGYVEKAKMTEGKVLVSAIAKSELAYHVQHGYFYNTPGTISRDSVLDIDASGNKYFRLFFARSNTPMTVTTRQQESLNSISKGALVANEIIDSVLIEAGYESPQGWLVVSMIAYSNGGFSDMETYRYGYGGGGDEEIA